MMAKNVKCKNCNNLNRNSWWCEKVVDSPDTELLRDCPHFWERTNADRIRAITDEELCMWAKKQIGCGFDFFPCGVVCDGKCEAYDDETCRAKILNWLKQPAEVSHD